MEEEKPPAAAELGGEATEVVTEVTTEVTPEVMTEVTTEVVTEVMTEVLKKEECVAETLTVVTATVGSFDEKSQMEEKEPEDTGKIEEEDEAEVEKERIWREGEEEEEKGRAKNLTGLWESEVRTCVDGGALLGGGR